MSLATDALDVLYLRRGPVDSADVAAALGKPAHRVRGALFAAVELGLAVEDGSVYALTAAGEELVREQRGLPALTFA